MPPPPRRLALVSSTQRVQRRADIRASLPGVRAGCRGGRRGRRGPPCGRASCAHEPRARAAARGCPPASLRPAFPAGVADRATHAPCVEEGKRVGRRQPRRKNQRRECLVAPRALLSRANSLSLCLPLLFLRATLVWGRERAVCVFYTASVEAVLCLSCVVEKRKKEKTAKKGFFFFWPQTARASPSPSRKGGDV